MNYSVFHFAKIVALFLLLFTTVVGSAQVTGATDRANIAASAQDTVPVKKAAAMPDKPEPLADFDEADYDELFNELDLLLDSLYTPRSFGIINIGLANGSLSYSSVSDTALRTQKKIIFTPTIGYYSKYGLGISAGASIVKEPAGYNAFQYSLTGSYDYMRDRRFLTGFSFTRFFTGRQLAFYTSPLANELYAYFTQRKLWFKPSVGLSYGWGSREQYEIRQQQIAVIKKNNRKKQGGNPGTTVPIQITTVEQVADFNITTSVRHDFFFLKIFSNNDYVRLTPQLALVSGSHQFGFQQSANTFGPTNRAVISELYTNANAVLQNGMNIKPLSLTAFLKTEYVKSNFFIQPQVALDYYFPATSTNFTTTFLINAGYLF